MKGVMNRAMGGPPLENSYWVVPGLFLAGQYPGALDPRELEAKLNRLLDAGIRMVLNLMEPGEVNWDGVPFAPYEERLRELALARGSEVETVRLAVRDMDVPSRAMMTDILDLVERCLDGQAPVFVHCLGGRGRTGTVAGCFLRRRNLAGPGEVLDRLRELRQKGRNTVGDSPETRAQRELVVTWAAGE